MKQKKREETETFSCSQGSIIQTVFLLEISCWHCLPLFFLPSFSVLVPAVVVCFILVISHPFVFIVPSRLRDSIRSFVSSICLNSVFLSPTHFFHLVFSLSLSLSFSFVHTVIWIWTHGHSAAIGRDGMAERIHTWGKRRLDKDLFSNVRCWLMLNYLLYFYKFSVC